MPELIPFEMKHMEHIDHRHWEEKLMPYTDSTVITEMFTKMGPSWTLIIAGKVVACAGVAILWKGVGEAWLITSPHINEYAMCFYRTLKRRLQEIVKTHHLHRVQADVEAGFEESHKMMLHLGFEQESVMEHYGPNKENFVRYRLLCP